MAENQNPSTVSDWRTHAEKTDYQETPRYFETISYAKRLAAASPLIEFQSFGCSGEGRDLPLLIATEGATFSPESARQAGKAVVLIQACIHAGEPDGKEAGLALLRDITITIHRVRRCARSDRSDEAIRNHAAMDRLNLTIAPADGFCLRAENGVAQTISPHASEARPEAVAEGETCGDATS